MGDEFPPMTGLFGPIRPRLRRRGHPRHLHRAAAKPAQAPTPPCLVVPPSCRLLAAAAPGSRLAPPSNRSPGRTRAIHLLACLHLLSRFRACVETSSRWQRQRRPPCLPTLPFLSFCHPHPLLPPYPLIRPAPGLPDSLLPSLFPPPATLVPPLSRLPSFPSRLPSLSPPSSPLFPSRPRSSAMSVSLGGGGGGGVVIPAGGAPPPPRPASSASSSDDEDTPLDAFIERLSDIKEALSESDVVVAASAATARAAPVVATARRLVGGALWVAATSAIVLLLPLLYEIDREVNAPVAAEGGAPPAAGGAPPAAGGGDAPAAAPAS